MLAVPRRHLARGRLAVGRRLVLSQLSLLQQRPAVRASVVAAALFLLAWSALLFGVVRRGQKVSLEKSPCGASTTCRRVSKARSSARGVLRHDVRRPAMRPIGDTNAVPLLLAESDGSNSRLQR